MRVEDPKIVAASAGAGCPAEAGHFAGRAYFARHRRHDRSCSASRSTTRFRNSWISSIAQGVPHKFLGGGSNLLVGDGELPWVVLQLVSPAAGHCSRRQFRPSRRRGRPRPHRNVLREKRPRRHGRPHRRPRNHRRRPPHERRRLRHANRQLRPRSEALPGRRPQARNPPTAIKFPSNTGTLLSRLMI